MLFAEAHEKIQIETKRNNNVYHANANHTEDNVCKLRSDKVDFWSSDITNNKKEYCLMIKWLILQ